MTVTGWFSDDKGPVPVMWRDAGADLPPSAAGGWGSSASADACRLVADSCDVLVIGIQGQEEREAARRAIREAIVAELALVTKLPLQRIALYTPEGQVPYALLDTADGERRAHLAISHDGTLSLAAISLQGPVGIDVTLVMDIPDWEAVARDYLGPAVTAALAALPADARAQVFARAWSEREARLKYLGRELVEWSEDGDRPLAACRCLPLALPEGYAGVLALAPGSA
jgi:4'-phosphopantetheinyl transferase